MPISLPPVIPLRPPCILSLYPYPRPIPFPTLSALSAHVLLQQLLPASQSVCSVVPTDPQPCLSPSACPARFTGRQPCSALLVTRPVLVYRPPALLALLATHPALLYWLPALARPYWPLALLYSSGHQSCSALLATSLATCWSAWPRPPPPPFSACPCSAWALHSLCLLSHTLAATTGGKKAKRECP